MSNDTTVVGMEIHVELKTASKMFCGCKNDPFHAPEPNMYTCPVCLGLPGALPVPNRKAVEWTIMLGLALHCSIPFESKFDRKNYFYPDLPKGYQISQYDQPIACDGYLVIPSVVEESSSRKLGVRDPSASVGMTSGKTIRIHRVHLEEDTGKLVHATVNDEKVTLIDFNRSGVPLVEIVTEPDLHSAEEAKLFLKKLHQIIRYLGISDADMEKGSMRLEPNISVIKSEILNPKFETNSKFEIQNSKLPKYKVEVKNINSFKFVGKAIEYEVKRQIELLDKGETPVQETRGWDEKKGVTLPQRRKEEAHDYRYFPEPDIPPMIWEKSYLLNLKSQIPEMPEDKLPRYLKFFGLPVQDAERLVEEKEMAEYFESVNRLAGSDKNETITPKIIANWLLNKKLDITKVKPKELIDKIISTNIVVTVNEKELRVSIDKVIAANSKAVADYKTGKLGVIMYLVGQVMRELKGKGDPQTIRKILEKELQ